MQTSLISGKRISVVEACQELAKDMSQNGMKGVFRGQGLGMVKAIVSLTTVLKLRQSSRLPVVGDVFNPLSNPYPWKNK